MITIALTNRNRDLRIIENCLNSLELQSNKSFQVSLVDYGSEIKYSEKLIDLTKDYEFVNLIQCPVYNQLWNKSRAINIALKQAKTKYFLVGDIDLIFHPDFINKALQSIQDYDAIYFKYSFLSKVESLKKVSFEAYKIDFSGGKEITGTTLFRTNVLNEFNGFDEFYHGWGAEDTDMHVRLKNLNKSIVFIEDDVLIKHQWHPKVYRSKKSTHPFHSGLEQINHKYLLSTEKNKITKVNLYTDWGLLPNKINYNKLEMAPKHSININNGDVEFAALLAHLKNIKDQIVEVNIYKTTYLEQLKQYLKRILKKKYNTFISLEKSNNLLLEEIIKNYRNKPYRYNFNREANQITFIIKL